MRVFVDTNLWVYRLDRREPEKSRWMAAWLRKLGENHEIVVSTEVLVELRAVMSRKLKPAFAADDMRAALEALALLEVVTTDTHLVLDAHELAQRMQLAWFDALIAEAAIRSHCEVLYSEDFSHGQRMDGVRIHNPFADPAVV